MVSQNHVSFCFLLKFIENHKILDPQEKIWDPRNTHEKKFETHEIPTRQTLGPTKAQWHGGTRSTMARDPRNLRHSLKYIVQNKARTYTKLVHY